MINGTGLPSGSCDKAVAFNPLHMDEPVALLCEAFGVLSPGGEVGLIHWNVDPATPRGPSMDVRPTVGTVLQHTLRCQAT